MSDPLQDLLEYSHSLEIVDAHEHFIGESVHLKRYLSFYDFFASYLQWDLYSAGMPKDLIWNYPKDEAEAIAWFARIEPYWHHVKHGSYARPIRLALEHFYGITDLNAETMVALGRTMNANNQPGRFDTVFDEAKIKFIINQSPDHPFDDPRFVYGKPIEYHTQESIGALLAANPGFQLEDLIATLEDGIAAAVRLGARSAKVFSVFLMQAPNREGAAEVLEHLRRGEPVDFAPLQTYLYDKTIEACGKHNIVATVHTGVWTDLNKQTPMLIFPVIERHPDVTFDVYHMGMPFVRECAFLGKSYLNAHLNLCWSHAVSESMALHALDEWLDLVPVNKISGFGGDLITVPEHVWGQLQVAKENIARALAHRIARDRLDLEDAKRIMKLWLFENPARLYKLP
jgi:uncharacterized protein